MTDVDALRRRRWRLALGGEDTDGLDAADVRVDRALGALYDGGKGRGGLGGSAPKVASWLGDLRELFPTSVVQVLQRDAVDRLGLRQLLVEPELLAVMEADVHLVATLIGLRGVIPDTAKDAARDVVRRVVNQVLERLELRTISAVRGALRRGARTRRPRAADVDWARTVRANLRNWQPELGTVIAETLHGRQRARPASDLDEIVLCIDQSGSMISSAIYASIFGAVLASIPGVRTRLAVFDTVVLDLSDELDDPVEVLFGLQLGGGTDIHQALIWCEAQVTRPTRTTVVLVTDLYEGGSVDGTLARAAALVASGVNLIVLLALSDDGRPSYDAGLAGRIASFGCPVFACTPDAFPDLMATALRRGDVSQWAAEQGIATVRAPE
jgi:Mg-chelatase subunit ChlD